MGLQRTLQDASGHLRTDSNPLIRKRPLASRSWTPSCQGGCRGFDPRFPLQQPHPRRSTWALSIPQWSPRTRNASSCEASDC